MMNTSKMMNIQKSLHWKSSTTNSSGELCFWSSHLFGNADLLDTCGYIFDGPETQSSWKSDGCSTVDDSEIWGAPVDMICRVSYVPGGFLAGFLKHLPSRFVWWKMHLQRFTRHSSPQHPAWPVKVMNAFCQLQTAYPKNQLGPSSYRRVWMCFLQGFLGISSFYQALEIPWFLG